MLRKPERSAAGYRRYEAQDAERIKLIRGAHRVSLRLSDIRQLLDVLDKGRCPCGHTERVLKERLAEVEEETARLGAVRSELMRFLRQFLVECERPEDWPCRDELIQIGRRGDPCSLAHSADAAAGAVPCPCCEYPEKV